MTDTPQSNPVASAGKIHMLDLTTLKERLGPKWDRMAGHVQLFFEAAIRRALAPGDTFCRFDELSYLVMFRDLPAAEADLKCATISEEVCRRLFGENGEQVSLRSLVAHVGLAKVPVGAREEAGLDELLERDGRETVVTQHARATLPAASRAIAARTMRLNIGGAPISRQPIALRDVAFVYRPIWDALNNVVVTYLCQPVVPALLPAKSTISDFVTAEEEDDQAFLDLRVLHECAERADRLRAAGLRIVLAMPVHFSTIARPRSWRDYSEALRKIPDEVARDTAFIILGIDGGVPHIRLAHEVPKLSKSAYRILCVLDRGQGAGARFARTGTHGIGTVLGEKDDELQSIARLQDIAKEANTAGLDSFLLGLGSTSLTLQSINVGIRYLEGPVVRPAVSDPRHGFSHGVENLYAAKLAAV